jgi:hypothetical protein
MLIPIQQCRLLREHNIHTMISVPQMILPMVAELKVKSRVSILVMVLVRPMIPSPNYNGVSPTYPEEQDDIRLTMIKVKQVMRSTRWVYCKEMDSFHFAITRFEKTSNAPMTYQAMYAVGADCRWKANEIPRYKITATDRVIITATRGFRDAR